MDKVGLEMDKVSPDLAQEFHRHRTTQSLFYYECS